MRLALIVVATNICFFCTTGVPTAPQPLSATVVVFGVVVGDGGACIPGAVVHVVRGQGTGRTLTQPTPCGAEGFRFDNLTPGVEMTLRASAAGFTPVEQTVVPAADARAAVILSAARLGR